MKQFKRARFLVCMGACVVCAVDTQLYELPAMPLPPEPKVYVPGVDELFDPMVQELVSSQGSGVKESQESQQVGPLTGKNPAQASNTLLPFLMSRSVEKAVEYFTNLPPDAALEILTYIIENDKINFKNPRKGRPFEVKRNDMIQIIFGVASQYQDTKTRQRFFNLIDQYQGLKSGIRPLLFVLSISSYPVLIPDFLAWLNSKGIKDAVPTAALYAVDRNSTRSLKALDTYTQDQIRPVLGQLLWHAVSSKKNPKIITLLVDRGADANYPHASGYTPLIKAVEMGNLALTKLLVEKGADIDLIVKDEIGSAWQKAGEITNVEIITYFADHFKRIVPTYSR